MNMLWRTAVTLFSSTLESIKDLFLLLMLYCTSVYMPFNVILEYPQDAKDAYQERSLKESIIDY